jgi:hypothetical protein
MRSNPSREHYEIDPATTCRGWVHHVGMTRLGTPPACHGSLWECRRCRLYVCLVHGGVVAYRLVAPEPSDAALRAAAEAVRPLGSST